jgi:hypothetical protein
LKLEWSDLYSGKSFRIHVGRRTNRTRVRARTYADVLDRYGVHPEPKSVAPDGSSSDEQTVGLLGRGDDHVVTVRFIGKEANLIEQQEEGVLLGDPQAVYDGPKNPGGWEAVRRRLGPIPATHLAVLTGLSPRMIRNVKRGERPRQHVRN